MEKRFVSLYDVTRQYGGPEEGGWWYNWFSHVVSVPMLKDRRASEKWIERKTPRWARAWKSRWERGSWRIRETRPGERATKHRPYYE